MARADYPAIAEWIERIEQRPAVVAATAAILVNDDRARYQQARARLTPQQWSTLFGEQLLAAARAG